MGPAASKKSSTRSDHWGSDGVCITGLRMRQRSRRQKVAGERCSHGHSLWLPLCGTGSQSNCLGEHLGRFPRSTLAVNCTAIGSLYDCRFAELAALRGGVGVLSVDALLALGFAAQVTPDALLASPFKTCGRPKTGRSTTGRLT